MTSLRTGVRQAPLTWLAQEAASHRRADNGRQDEIAAFKRALASSTLLAIAHALLAKTADERGRLDPRDLVNSQCCPTDHFIGEYRCGPAASLHVARSIFQTDIFQAPVIQTLVAASIAA